MNDEATNEDEKIKYGQLIDTGDEVKEIHWNKFKCKLKFSMKMFLYMELLTNNHPLNLHQQSKTFFVNLNKCKTVLTNVKIDISNCKPNSITNLKNLSKKFKKN